jgi:uncharacterized cupredoxin-like copper-binding protein
MTGLRTAFTGLAFLLGATGASFGAGDLSLRPTVLPDLVLGTDDTGFDLSQKEYNLETGKSYRLKINASGKHQYALVAPELFDNIWLRKVEAGGMEIKANRVFELEFERKAQAEIFFVPIRPGTYRMIAKGLESKGVVILFNVK